MQPTRTLLSAALAAMAFAGAAHAADAAKPDQDFMMKAAAGGMYEVEAGKLAESKGKSDGVKSFGTMLQKDHSAANDELKALAGKKGVTLPTALPADKQKKLDKLNASKDFDKDFIKEVGLADHKKDIADFDKESKSGKDADAKAFAAKTLPTLKTHMEHAQMLAKGDAKK